MATKLRSKQTRKTTATTKAPSKTVTLDSLTNTLKTNLHITGSKKSTKAPEAPLSSSELMKRVNNASAKLAALVRGDSKSESDAVVQALSETCLNAYRALRKLAAKPLDVERSAFSVITKLIALEKYDAAICLLADVKLSLGRICGQQEDVATENWLQYVRLSKSAHYPKDEIHSTLIAHYLSQSIATLSWTVFSSPAASNSTSSDAALEQSLDETLSLDSLLQWLPELCPHIPSEQYDRLIMRTYTSLMQGSAAQSQSHCRTVFAIRVYGLMCLLKTTDGFLEPDKFWTWANRFLVSAMQKLMSSEVGAGQTVVAAFARIQEAVTAREDSDRFFNSLLFVKFTEYRLECAAKIGDASELERIGRKAHSARAKPSRTGNGNPNQSHASSAMDALSMCAILVQASTRLEDALSEPATINITWFANQHATIRDVLARTMTLLVTKDDEHSTSTATTSSGRVSKVWKAVEGLRRTSLKVLSDPVCGHGAIFETAHSFLEGIVKALEGAAAQDTLTEILTPLLDTVFNLARLALDPSNPQTHQTSFQLLSRAMKLPALGLNEPLDGTADLVPKDGNSIDLPTRLNYQRCVSNAFHNIGAALYQASKHAAASRFVKLGSQIGSHALRKYHSAGLHEAVDSEKGKLWAQLEEQLYPRWDLLGSCCIKMGERQAAYDAFVQAIASFPIQQSGLIALMEGCEAKAVFEASALNQKLALSIDRATFLAVNELLMSPERVPLARVLRESLALGRLESEEIQTFIGLVLEKQLEVLEASKGRLRVQAALKPVLDGILSAYTSAGRPVRAARCGVRSLALSYSTQLADHVSSVDSLQTLDGLSKTKDLFNDASLSHLIPLYQATGYFWMVLHAHKETSREKALEYANTGLELVRAIMPQIGGSSLGQDKPKAATVRGRTRRPAAVVKPLARTKKAPVTPTNGPSDRADALQPTTTHVDYSELLELLMTVSIVVNMLGAFPLRMSALFAVRGLSESQASLWGDYYVQSSVELAQEYLGMGQITKASTMYSQVVNTVKEGDLTDEVQVRFLLKRAELLAPEDEWDQSVAYYIEASKIAEQIIDDDTVTNTAGRAAVQVKHLERVALAAHAFSTIQQRRNDPSLGIEALQQALRLWNRAARVLSRLGASKSANNANPFAMDSITDALPRTGADKATFTESKPLNPPLLGGDKGLDAAQWRIAQGTLETLLALARTYFARGSNRESEYFALQAQELAEAISAHLMIARALLHRAELQVSLGKLAEARKFLDKADIHLKGAMVIDYADALRLRGVCKVLDEDRDSAREYYENASSALGKLERTLEKVEGTRSHNKTPGQVADFAPAIVASILRRHAWLIREDADDHYEQILERLSALPDFIEVQVELHAIIGKLTLDEAFSQCKSDMFLSSIAESTIAMPMGLSNDKSVVPSSATQDVLAVLSNAEHLFRADLELLARRGTVSHVREAAVSLVMITALRSSLGVPTSQAPLLAARLLDASVSVTISREMLESIKDKHADASTVDDMRWPSISDSGTPLPPGPSQNHKKRAKVRQLRFESDDEESDVEDEGYSTKTYWSAVRERHSASFLDPLENTGTADIDTLPEHWIVVHMSITEDKSAMFVSRQQARREPLVFCLPLKGRRDSEEDEQLGFDDAVDELDAIINESDESTRAAVHVSADDKEARAAWWTTRGALDKRMKTLVENIEFCWLGGFKAILSRPSGASSQDLDDLRVRLENVFHRALHIKSPKDGVQLTQRLVECFGALAPKSRDEELEDVVYFVLDLYQAAGVPVVLSEVDVDHTVIELRMALEEHTTRVPRTKAVDDDIHVFLVLDKNLQGLPWESIPILRGRSVSRVPNLAFLRDRVELARQRQGVSADACVDRAVIDPGKTFYILNPSGDLKGTEARFTPLLREMKSAAGWTGIVGRAPSEQEFLAALEREELVVYFGHGGGENYVRSHKIRALPRCAATMLWGCSSGRLKPQGEFDRTGTPYHYMLAGCPTLVANLWDVTDRDIDKFTQTVFDKLALTPTGVRDWTKRRHKHSIVEAVAEAREVCKLKYLTGAAPVVYGIPFYL